MKLISKIETPFLNRIKRKLESIGYKYIVVYASKPLYIYKDPENFIYIHEYGMCDSKIGEKFYDKNILDSFNKLFNENGKFK